MFAVTDKTIVQGDALSLTSLSSVTTEWMVLSYGVCVFGYGSVYIWEDGEIGDRPLYGAARSIKIALPYNIDFCAQVLRSERRTSKRHCMACLQNANKVRRPQTPNTSRCIKHTSSGYYDASHPPPSPPFFPRSPHLLRPIYGSHPDDTCIARRGEWCATALSSDKNRNQLHQWAHMHAIPLSPITYV